MHRILLVVFALWPADKHATAANTVDVLVALTAETFSEDP